MKKTAVVLLSGGLDSTTVLAMAKDQGFDPYTLSFSYGQRHSVELESARKVAESLGSTRHVVGNIDLRIFGGSALTSDIDVPKHDSADEVTTDIPSTYVPARNTIFLSFALAYAETVGAQDIFLGVNALDYSGYPDCRPEFIAAYEAMANLATKAGVEGTRLSIHTPLMEMTKAQIVTEGTRLGVDYSITSSCYDPDTSGRACGHCDSCLLRLRGFEEAGLSDPSSTRQSDVTYKVKEIFYTLQGEGAHAGRPAVFCRFTSCNLWTGRESDRHRAICKFCDTDFVGTDGPGGGKFATARDLAQAVTNAWPTSDHAHRMVVCTGGEPLLQMDADLTRELHEQGFYIAVETNGTQIPPEGIDWLCVSPKKGSELVVESGDELKLVYPQDNDSPADYEHLNFKNFRLQPMDSDSAVANTASAVEYCLEHPKWQLSLQTHKYLGIP